jgi:hypothetical protein
MSDNTFVCAREGCDETAHRKKHNQKYCSDECCRLATNQRIMEKYYERQAQRQGKTRHCRVCGITKLSRYNTGSTCAPCTASGEVAARNAIVDMLNSASATV